jgi:hypothetical protein
MNLQELAFTNAKSLASNSQEYSHLIAKMSPEHALRLKHFILKLPENIANKTIYGRCALRNQEQPTKSRGRKKK